MVDFSNIIENLIDIGFYDVLLPFLLVYAVIFAILEKTGIFAKSDGSDNNQTRNVNAIIAFVFGLFVVASLQTVRYIQDLIVNIVLFVIFILVSLILLGFIFGKDYFDHLFKDADGRVKKGIVWSVALIVMAIAIGILFYVLGVWDWLDDYWNWDFNDGTLSSILVVALIIGVLFWITSGDKSESKKIEGKD